MSKISKLFTRAGVVGISWSLALAVSVMLLAGGYPGSGVASTLQAAAAPGLGAAQSFAVLAAAGVTNTGPTKVTGDLGTHPTAAVTGFFGTTANEGPGTVTGQIHQADATALSARNALTAAYNNAAGQPTDFAVGTELGGKTLAPGVYASGTFGITAGAGPLTLNGNANDIWVFKAGSTLITSASSSVVLAGGAQACNVFWQIGSSATLGASSTLQGTVMAHTTITVGNSATVVGRLLAGAVADSGAVTLDNDTIAVSACALPPAATPTPTAVPATPTPTAIPATPTATAIPATPTATAIPATPTATAIPATPTATPPPGATPTATAIPATPTATPPPGATPTATPPVETPIAVLPTIAAPVDTPTATPTPTPVGDSSTQTVIDTPTATSVATPVGDTSTQTVTVTPGLPRTGGFPLPMEIIALSGLALIGLGWLFRRLRQQRHI